MAATPSSGGAAAPSLVRQLPAGGSFACWQHDLEYVTEPGPSFRDITEEVHEIVAESGVVFGQATVYSNHTTAAIRLQENEPLLIEDMRDALRRLAPQDADYRHNDFEIRTVNMNPDESPNGHSHCQHLFLGTSETIPVVDGRLLLGRWQSIFLVELDGSRPRRVTVNVLGVGAE